MAAEGQMENVQVLLVKDPTGRRVEVEDMEVVKRPFTVPSPLEPGTLALKNLYFSLDPYMRGRMNLQAKSYFQPFKLGEVMQTVTVAEVIAGSRDDVAVGDTVVASMVGWEKYSLAGTGTRIIKLDPAMPFSPTLVLGIMGLTGATAYHGLDLCKPSEGQTIFVSGAAGAVGLAVGQMAKAKGLKVIGSAGSDNKVKMLLEQFGFDAAFNYKTVQGKVQEKLQELAPEGLDSYFDNVGGEHLDAALGCMKQGGRAVECGMISMYNGETFAYKNLSCIVFKEITVQGFLISAQLADPEFMAKFRADVGTWLAEGKLSPAEHIVDGIEKTPEAFVGLFEGINVGKLVIKV